MDHALVDLSLFNVSLNDDNLFTLPDEALSASAFGPSSKNIRGAPTMKPLPPIPHRRLGALTPDHRSDVANPTRVILERVKNIRIDSERPTSRSQSLKPPSAPLQTLQQRRNPDSTTPSLTIPTPSHPPTLTKAPASAAAVTTCRPAAPMIWLADEEMWLVADAYEQSAESQTDLYGFYAPAPHSDPGPYGQYSPESFGQSPPPYSESVAPSAGPSPTDFSPLQAQWSQLLESQSSLDVSTAATSRPRVQRESTANISPEFQAAISGMDFDPSCSGTSSSRAGGKRDSWHSESGVSEVTLVNSLAAERPSRWMRRRASGRH